MAFATAAAANVPNAGRNQISPRTQDQRESEAKDLQSEQRDDYENADTQQNRGHLVSQGWSHAPSLYNSTRLLL